MRTNEVISIIQSVSGLSSDREFHKSDFFLRKIPIFLNMCASCSELPSSTMSTMAVPGPYGVPGVLRSRDGGECLLHFHSLCIKYLMVFKLDGCSFYYKYQR